MPYKVFMRNKYTGAVDEIEDEVYETKADAEDALSEIENDFSTGYDVLEEAGHAAIDPTDVEFFVKKV
ncbi:hypothetical protein [Proteiniclasticum ruminis]|uniref:hypothetical protein n=1 Tax=Proteiniclasticum ruminis TaxID=398199 RepID=UPI0028AFBF81|nr:hypothetical protein [Proteiniclasticum ruminis]